MLRVQVGKGELPRPVAVKVSEIEPGQTCVYYSWHRGREVRVVNHDDCNLTTLQNLRTGSTWTVSSYTVVHTTDSYRLIYEEAKRLGIVYYGPWLGGK